MAAGDLITLAYLKVALEVDGVTASDAALSQLITEASGVLRDYTGREYVSVGAAEARTFSTAGWDQEHGLRIGDLSSAGAITAAALVAADGTETVLTPATHLELLPRVRKAGRPYEAARIIGGMTGSGQLLRLTADWGWVEDPANLPAHVKRAAVLTVHAWSRRSPAEWDAVEGEDGRLLYPTPPGGWALPTAAKQLVARDRIRGIG
jgi:hypothetical protein